MIAWQLTMWISSFQAIQKDAIVQYLISIHMHTTSGGAGKNQQVFIFVRGLHRPIRGLHIFSQFKVVFTSLSNQWYDVNREFINGMNKFYYWMNEF